MTMDTKALTYFQTLGELLSGTIATNHHRHKELPLDDALQQAVSLVLPDETLIEKRKIMIIGNGGSAAIASQGNHCRPIARFPIELVVISSPLSPSARSCRS